MFQITLQIRAFRIAGIFALILGLAPIGAFAMSDPDRPVSSDQAQTVQPQARTGVAGTVRSPDGDTVSGAMIVARSLDSPTKPIPEIAILSNAQGKYLWPLKAGRYELTPVQDGRRGRPETVSVTSGAVTRLDLTLAR